VPALLEVHLGAPVKARDKTILRLVSSQVAGDGVVILIYAPASR
jgi:hypothetical protein